MTITAPVNGDLVDPAWAVEVTDVCNAMLALSSAWTDYSSTFTLTASTSNPTKGNSTYDARYRQVGKTVDVDIAITVGSTFSAGSGTYYFSLPVAMRDLKHGTGSCYILDSGSQDKPGGIPFGDTVNRLAVIKNDGQPVAHNFPQVWATGDQIRLTFRYEVA